MGRDRRAPVAAVLHLAGGAPLLRPEEQVFAGMPDGWRAQQPRQVILYPNTRHRLFFAPGTRRWPGQGPGDGRTALPLV
jgi:hypothetical protein